MEKKQLTRFIILVLVALNLSLILFIYLGSKNHPHPPHIGPQHHIESKLNFTESQKQEFALIIQKHQKNIRSMEKERFLLKKKLYKLLTIPSINTQPKDSLIDLLSKTNKKVEEIHFNHFLELKAICRKDQLSKFNELSLEFPTYFASPMKKK